MIATTLVSQSVFLIDKEDFNVFSSADLYCFEDKSGNVSFETLSKTPSQYFKLGEAKHYNLSKSHWFLLKFKLKPECINEHLLFELFDFKFQKGEMYMPQPDGSYRKYDFGNLHKFETKEIYHKNFIWDLNIEDTVEHTVFFKIQSNINSKINGAIRTDNNFISWALDEYFYLALFYGVAITVLLYNTFIYINLKDKTYLYYSFYIVASIIWSLSNDGLGFQYLWRNVPFINQYIHPIATLLMITFLALYSRLYLNLNSRDKIFDHILISMLVLRTLPYILLLLKLYDFDNLSLFFFLFDANIILYLLIIAFDAKIRELSNYIIAFTFLLIGYISYWVYMTGHYKPSLYGYYSVNIGIALNMIVLALALVSRLKHLIFKTNQINNQLLFHLREKEQLQENQKRQLEELVRQRTKEYAEKNEELNSFIYRASHDIKGPISSLIGLANISKMESNPDVLKEYFKHVLLSSEKLDKTLSDLLQLSHVNESTNKAEACNVKILVEDVLLLKNFNQKYTDTDIIVEVPDTSVNLDARLVKPILQNLVENSLKYSDSEKHYRWVKIKIEITLNFVILSVSDNGQGIDDKYRDKIFDKFFRLGLKGSGSGLGLHIVKRCVEKLNGSIEVSSKQREGSVFKIKIPLN